MGRNSFYSAEEFAATQAEKIWNAWLEAATEANRRNAASYVLPPHYAISTSIDAYTIPWLDGQHEDAVDIRVDSIKDFLI